VVGDGDVSFARQPGVNRKQIYGFAELEFIAKAKNVIGVGKTGVGKTGGSCGLLLKALENGYLNLEPEQSNVFLKLSRPPHQLLDERRTSRSSSHQFSAVCGERYPIAPSEEHGELSPIYGVA
jgi:hypothetical protein